MLPRTLEPEVMDTDQEARDYDSMDHSTVNRAFVDDLLAATSRNGQTRAVDGPGLRILDVGTGTAQIPIELCRRPLRCHVVAIDLAVCMLQLAERNLREAALDGQVILEHVDAKGLPFDDASFDVVMSNSIVHHIPDPVDCLREMLRVLKPGGLLFVRDLLRPATADQVESLVAQYAADCDGNQRQLFRQSLHAALTVDEIRDLIQTVGCTPDSVSQTSDRHWTVSGPRPPV